MDSNFNIIHKTTVSSTNDDAKKKLQTEITPNFTVISATEQLIGKGLRKNSWHSQSGKNLTISIITYPKFLKVTEQFYLSKMISLGILEYLKTKGKYFKIKWPNDIYINDKKVCGILIESSIAGSTIKNSVIGIGLNINQTDFPKNLPSATSLALITGKVYQLDTELNILLTNIYEFYNDLKKLNFSRIDNLYHTNLYKINKLNQFKDSTGTFFGTITGTTSDGKLIINTANNQIKTYNFKEIEFI